MIMEQTRIMGFYDWSVIFFKHVTQVSPADLNKSKLVIQEKNNCIRIFVMQFIWGSDLFVKEFTYYLNKIFEI